MRLGLVLLPEREASNACERLSRALVGGRSPRVALGPNAAAHITLAHVETQAEPAAAWEESRHALEHGYRVDFLALAFLRYDTPYNAPAASPATMAWLIVPATRALRGAEQKTLDLSWVRAGTVTTGNGDKFQPHITLAIWEGEPVLELPSDIVGRTDVEARLALGVIGANGACERLLFSV